MRGQVGGAVALFGRQMSGLLRAAERGVGAAVDHVLSNMGYEELLREKSPEDWEDRIENVMELRSVVPEGDLAEALAEAALFTDADTQDADDLLIPLEIWYTPLSRLSFVPPARKRKKE